MTETQIAPIPAIWGNVPQRNMNFTGRDDILGILRQGLSENVAAVLPHALQGMGGVGKTAVAVEYAHRYGFEYELVWWIPAERPELVQSSLAALGERIGLASATATAIPEAATATLDALRRGEPFKRWLLVFDNADEPEDLKEIIPWGPGDVLITSRNHRWKLVVEAVQVDVFSREESTQFLNKRVPGVSETDANALAEELGDLPLALDQAGALQVETGMSVDEYLRLLKDQVAEIMAEGKSPDYPLSITAAWKLSVLKLAERHPEAIPLLRCCAFFSAEPIPRDLLPQGAHALTNEELGRLLADPIKLARAIRELGRFALVRVDGRMISIHRLIQALQRDELTPEEREAYREQAHIILAYGAPKDPDDNRQWPRYTSLVAHAQSTGLEQSGRPEVRRFALDVVRYLYNSGNNDSAKDFAERLIRVWRGDMGPTDRTMLQAQQHLGNVLRALGRYGPAFAVDQETLTRARESLGEEDNLTMVQTSSYTADLRGRGDFAQALEIDLRSLELHRRVLGVDAPLTLRVSNNLAVDYGLNSRYPDARDQHHETYRLRTESGADIPAADLLSSWAGLARALRLCGDYSEARDVGQDAHDFGVTQLGPDHPRTVEAAIDLSIALRRTSGTSGSAYEDALQFAAEVYGRSQHRFGASHPLTLASAISLTNIQRTTDLVREALDLAIDTAEQYRKIYGAEHPYYYGCRGNVAVLCRVTGDAQKAFEIDEQTLQGLETRLGKDHHYTLTVAVNLASDYATLGDATRALELGKDTLPRLRAVLGEDHQLTLGCAANMVPDLRHTGSEAEADRLFADTIHRYQQTLGTNHADTVVAEQGRRIDPDFDSPQI